LGGLPPNFPFSRDEAAFRFDRTEPRHAGQKQTRSIRWIGHFGIPYLLALKSLKLESSVLGLVRSISQQFPFLFTIDAENYGGSPLQADLTMFLDV
jgi:hypothetical protein